jgi:hypothetical protein
LFIGTTRRFMARGFTSVAGTEMQYVRRRIQRVSGVTVRDERIESRDFSVKSLQEWDGIGRQDDDRTVSQAEARALQRIGAAHRERT